MELVYETPSCPANDQQAYEDVQVVKERQKSSSSRTFAILVTVGAVILLIISVTALVMSLKVASDDQENEKIVQALKVQLNDLKAEVKEMKSLNVTSHTAINLLERMKGNLDKVNSTLSSRINSYHAKPVLATCPDNYLLNPFSNTCYGLVAVNKTWQEAKEYCEDDGGYLATFGTLESASWFLNLRKTLPAWGRSSVWLGGTKNADNTWAWHGRITGAFTLSIWARGHPDNDHGLEGCLDNHYELVERPYYTFNDFVCSNKQFFVCEKN